MLFAGWEVRKVKNTVTEVLKMLPEAPGRGQHFHYTDRPKPSIATHALKLSSVPSWEQPGTVTT